SVARNGSGDGSVVVDGQFDGDRSGLRPRALEAGGGMERRSHERRLAEHLVGAQKKEDRQSSAKREKGIAREMPRGEAGGPSGAQPPPAGDVDQGNDGRRVERPEPQ